MFDAIYIQPRTRALHRAAPLADERARFLTHLASQGLTREKLRSAAEGLLRIVDILDLANRPGESIALSEIRRKVREVRSPYGCLASHWLQFLGRLAPPPDPFSRHANLIKPYAEYLRLHKDVSPRTIFKYCQMVQQLLDRLDLPDDSLQSVSINQIDDILLEQIHQLGLARQSVQGRACCWRIFFRYAATRGWCKASLADGIRGPRLFSHTSLPLGPSWDEVQRLLAMTQGDRPVHIRDRAILMLLAVYGLRSGEVLGLLLESFDWENEMMRLPCPKLRRERLFPLTRPVGDAILRYLREVRPQSPHRELFLTCKAPIGPLRTLWYVVYPRLRSLGVTAPHQGPHSLRHACATHLLAEGFSLKEIGDQLGHRHPDTTRIYAKVDLAGLRQVADFDLAGLP
jgi:site-specific recombinase XerD